MIKALIRALTPTKAAPSKDPDVGQFDRIKVEFHGNKATATFTRNGLLVAQDVTDISGPPVENYLQMTVGNIAGRIVVKLP